MPARPPRIQCPNPCRRLRTMESWARTSHRREILPVKPRANAMDLPVINQRAARSTMNLDLPNRASLLPNPHPIPPRPNTHLLYRVSLPTISYLRRPQISSPTSRPRPLHRRLTMGKALHRRTAGNWKAANRTALPRAARARQIQRKRNAGRANSEGGEADKPVIRDRIGGSLPLPDRNWFAGGFPLPRTGRSS